MHNLMDVSIFSQLINTVGNVLIVLIMAAFSLIVMGGVAIVWVARKISRAISRQINGEPVQAETVKVPDRGLSAEAKEALAREAIHRCLAASRQAQSLSYAEIQRSLERAAAECQSPASKAELKRLSALYASLDNFLKGEKNFAYSSQMLHKAMCGLCSLLKSAAAADARLVAGMMYALERMQAKLRSNSGLAIAINSPELTEELDALTVKLDKLGWLFFSYPENGKKYTEILGKMVSQVEENLNVYANALQYGVESSETAGFLKNAKKTLAEINTAAQGILNDILNQDIMQADVEMEVLRQDIRMRGLGR